MRCPECDGEYEGEYIARHRPGCTQPGAGGYQWLFTNHFTHPLQGCPNSYAHLFYCFDLPRASRARIEMDADELSQYVSAEYGPPRKFYYELPLPYRRHERTRR